MASKSTLALDRASQRAQERAAAKASRAAAAGLKLPIRKKKNGWAILKEKWKDGTLLPQLRVATGSTGYNLNRRRSSAAAAAAKKQSLYAIRTHLAEVAYQIHARTSIGGSKANAKMMQEQAKFAQELQKKKRAERSERRKLIKKQKKLERELEYLNFPTILGWYFDGFFSPYFQLNEEYAAIFNQMEQEISKNKENSIKETFAEKAKRYFWPPDILGGYCFRTRGIYLDFKEIMKDPPHTPPEVILDQRVEAVTLFVSGNMDDDESKVPSDEDIHMQETTTSVAQMTAEEERVRKLLKAIDDDPNLTPEEKAARKKALLFALKKKKQKNTLQQRVADEMHFKAINKNDFYFDDQKPGFFKKKAADRDKYYYDSKWNVWRIKRSIIHYPNDYFWDESLAMFFPKDRTRVPDYYLYDPSLGAYRVAGEPMLPNWKGIKPIHFFFDHRIGKWVKKAKAHPGVNPVFDSNGNRFCANKKFDTPDDFYFDATTLKFQKKRPEDKYIYDGIIGAWRILDSKPPEKDQKKPIDFYWNEQEHAFVKKDAPSSFFAWDGNNKFFRKKKSLHGKFHPKNWYWFDKEKSWKLKKTTSRTDLVSQSLHWRPDRDYDKPWLEYIGGFRDYHLEYDYDSDEDDVPPKTAASGGKILDRTATQRTKDASKTADMSESGVGAVGAGKSGRKLHFSASEPTIKTKGGTKDGEPGSEMEPGSSYKDMQGVGTTKEPEKNEELAYIDTIDRKTLKATNLGKMVNDTDLRKYFASVKKIVRPKVPGTDEDEEYAYLKFKTDEAAAAALKTMHKQIIRGQQIKLSYKLKAEDETQGGHAETIQQPSIL